MDTFFDKLSSKLTAQEMIRANGAAENEEMNALKVQVSEYQACLDKMQQVCTELNGLHGQLSLLSVDNPRTDAQTQEALGHIQEAVAQLTISNQEQLDVMARMSASNKEQIEAVAMMTAANKEKLEATGAGLESMEQRLAEKIGSGESEDFHKEGVRIYRNVQASIQEESGKLMEAVLEMDKKVTQIRKKVSGLKGITITALVLAAVALAGEIFTIVMNYL